MWYLPAADGHAVDGMPPARNKVQNRDEADYRPCQVHAQLHHVGPDDGFHAAPERVNQGQNGDDGDGRNIAAEIVESAQQSGERDPHDDGHREHADPFRGGACNQEQARCQSSQLLSEAAVDQLVGRDQIAPEVMGDEQEADDDAADHIAKHQLQEPEVASHRPFRAR